MITPSPKKSPIDFWEDDASPKLNLQNLFSDAETLETTSDLPLLSFEDDQDPKNSNFQNSTGIQLKIGSLFTSSESTRGVGNDSNSLSRWSMNRRFSSETTAAEDGDSSGQDSSPDDFPGQFPFAKPSLIQYQRSKFDAFEAGSKQRIGPKKDEEQTGSYNRAKKMKVSQWSSEDLAMHAERDSVSTSSLSTPPPPTPHKPISRPRFFSSNDTMTDGTIIQLRPSSSPYHPLAETIFKAVVGLQSGTTSITYGDLKAFLNEPCQLPVGECWNRLASGSFHTVFVDPSSTWVLKMPSYGQKGYDVSFSTLFGCFNPQPTELQYAYLKNNSRILLGLDVSEYERIRDTVVQNLNEKMKRIASFREVECKLPEARNLDTACSDGYLVVEYCNGELKKAFNGIATTLKETPSLKSVLLDKDASKDLETVPSDIWLDSILRNDAFDITQKRTIQGATAFLRAIFEEMQVKSHHDILKDVKDDNLAIDLTKNDKCTITILDWGSELHFTDVDIHELLVTALNSQHYFGDQEINCRVLLGMTHNQAYERGSKKKEIQKSS
jgi:hypothetical protein